MKPVLIICFLLVGALHAAAQEKDTLEKIETDRPDQTESPTIVPKGWLQAELGVERKLEPEGFLYTLPTVLTKYGVSKKLELRLLTENNSLYKHHLTDSFGLQPVKVGFKYNLLEEKGIVPQTSLLAHTGLNRLASRYFKGLSFFAPEFRLAMQHTLSDVVGLGYNIGAEWESTDEKPDFIYTLAPGFNLGERWYAFVELFGSVKRGEGPEHNADAGVAYHVSQNFRVDFSGGIGLTKQAFDHFLAAGFSFRIPVSKKAIH
ncbi:MAG TPA: transporter [Chitinophagaceae bacterium]|nr:transporter [Chitinophagaceae bacterium]